MEAQRRLGQSKERGWIEMLGGGDLPFSDIFVTKNTTVRSADGLVVAVESAESGRSVNLDTLHLGA